MAELAEGQYELVDLSTDMGYVFGKDCPVVVSKVEFGAADTTTADSESPRSDGTWFGRDYKAGRTITIEGHVLVEPSLSGSLDALAELEAAWQGDGVRFTPSATTVLRWRRGGRVRRVWGRPRRFVPTPGRSHQGWIPFTADFRTIDHLYYADVETTLNVPYVPAESGGFPVPFIGPWTAESTGQASGVIIVRGTRPAWLGYSIHGPIGDPEIEIPGRWSAKLRTDVAFDKEVHVRPAPWERSVRSTDGANLSGRFTADSQRVALMRVPPGSIQVLLRGYDPTGTSYVTVRVRETFASY